MLLLATWVGCVGCSCSVHHPTSLGYHMAEYYLSMYHIPPNYKGKHPTPFEQACSPNQGEVGVLYDFFLVWGFNFILTMWHNS